jgi:hypothetical protein
MRYLIKNATQHRIKLIAWRLPTYENLRRFSIRFVFAKLVAETRNEIIHKHVSIHLKNRH